MRQDRVRKILMRRLQLILIFFLLFSANSFAQDRIIAVVNHDIITQKDLNDFLNFTRMQLSRDYQGKELESRIQSMRLDLLDRLIEDQLILQQARRNKLQIDESRIKAKIDEVRRRYPTDLEFQQALASQGLTQSDLEKKIREQFLMRNIIEIEVRSKVVVSPSEVTDYYNNNEKQFLSPEERQLEAISMDDADMAKAVSYELRRGGKMIDLATRYPMTVNKMNVSQGQELRRQIDSAVFGLSLGEVSEPIKVGEKYYIFKLENIVPPKQLTLQEAKPKIFEYLYDQKIEERLNDWLADLRKRSYIKVTND